MANHHAAVLPLALDFPPGHADAAAVSGEVFAQAGSSGSGTNPVGQRLAGQAEDRCGGVRAVRLNVAQGAGGGLGERHCRRVRLILALLDREAGRPVRPEFHVTHGSGLPVRAPVVARRLHAPAGSPVPISLGWTSRRSDSSSMASAMSKAWSANAITSRWRPVRRVDDEPVHGFRCEVVAQFFPG